MAGDRDALRARLRSALPRVVESLSAGPLSERRTRMGARLLRRDRLTLRAARRGASLAARARRADVREAAQEARSGADGTDVGAVLDGSRSGRGDSRRERLWRLPPAIGQAAEAAHAYERSLALAPIDARSASRSASPTGTAAARRRRWWSGATPATRPELRARGERAAEAERRMRSLAGACDAVSRGVGSASRRPCSRRVSPAAGSADRRRDGARRRRRGLDLVAIDLQDDVARADPRLVGGAAVGDAGHDSARHVTAVAELAAGGVGQRVELEAEVGDRRRDRVARPPSSPCSSASATRSSGCGRSSPRGYAPCRRG